MNIDRGEFRRGGYGYPGADIFGMNLGPWSERRFYGPAPGDILGYGPSWRTGMGYGPDAAIARARSLLGPDWGPTPAGFGDVGMGPSDLGLGDLSLMLPSADIGVGRRVDEGRYQKLPDYSKVLDNPNIDEATLWRPRCDIFDEGPDRLRVEFELPGVPKEDISLTIQENILTLAALKPQTRKEETGFHYQTERHFGKFYRRLQLPMGVDASNIRAHMENGVLKVHLNKKGGPSGRISISEGIGAGMDTTGTATTS